MKKMFIIFGLLLGGMSAFAQGFVVKEFTGDIYLNVEGFFDVVENYEIMFTVEKHGIYREIITDYRILTSGGEVKKRKIFIENIEVPGQIFTINPGFEQRLDEKVKIKIGDRGKLVTGIQHYKIKYRVFNAFLFEDSLVHFYWNLKPQGWSAIFEKTSFNIHIPSGIPISNSNCFVYAGISGTTQPSADFDYEYQDGRFSGKSHQYFFSVPGQDITILMKLPRNAIKDNFVSISAWKQYGWIGILMSLLLAFWLIWLRYGRDDKVITMARYYPPGGIDPAMAGYLIDDKGDASDLISLLPHWATQHIISIEEFPKGGFLKTADMKITKLKNLYPDAAAYEQKIFNGLFGFYGDIVFVSILRNVFYLTMNEAKKELKAQAQRFYLSQSGKIMKVTMAIAIALGVLLAAVFLFFWGPAACVFATITCVFIAFMSFFLQKKNSDGNAVFFELKGFREFIKMAEIDRIAVLLKEDPGYFEKTMSYALAFGMLENWAGKFAALDMPPPEWYKSNGMGMTSLYTFSRSFSLSMSNAGSSMITSPSGSSSGGGGSSGGGFGGGGGGSW